MIMKRIFIFVFLLIVIRNANGAEMILQIQTPDTRMMLPPVSPPQLQKEGFPLDREELTVKEYFEYLDRGEYEKALLYLREKEVSTLELIEKGDPSHLLRQQVVASQEVLGPVAGTGHISAYLLYLIGHAYFTLERYKDAETAFLAALNPVPDYIRVHESLGMLYLKTERYEDARKHLARAAELGLSTATLFGALGYLNYRTDNFLGAVSAFQEALMLNPDNEQWKNSLLYSLISTYQHSFALNLVEDMLKEHPDNAGLWLYRAKAAYKSGNREAALSSMETAIRLGDQNVSNLQACAALHMELGSMERAVDLMKSGFVKGMDFEYMDKGIDLLELKEEWAFLEKAIGSMRERWGNLDDPQQSRLLMREADISLHKGDKTSAGKALEKAITLDPSNAYALIALAGIHREKREYNRAELLYQRASAYSMYREDALFSLAQLALDQEDYSRALQVLRDMLREFPGRMDINRNIESLENLVLLKEDS